MSTTKLHNTIPSRGNILIVDEDVQFIDALHQYLMTTYFVPTKLHNPNDLYSTIMKSEPDLVLCSLPLRVPLFQALNRILRRTKFPKPRIIFLTTLCTLEDIKFALEIGADDCLSKKLAPEVLTIAIESHIQSYTQGHTHKIFKKNVKIAV